MTDWLLRIDPPATDEEWDWAAKIVLRDERRKRSNARWEPKLLNGGYDFTASVNALIQRRRHQATNT